MERMNRSELAAFLRSRRERLRPADVGLPIGMRRRTPGLRREEVAGLTGMSVDYYIRLEQARSPHPSRQLLGALAGALRLSDDERSHLFHLAGEVPQPAHHSGEQAVRPGVLHLLDHLVDTPALVVNDRTEVLAWNRLAAALVCDFAAYPVEQRNFLWLHFCDHRSRERFDPADWERTGRNHVADIRALAARRPDDQELAALVARLRAASPEFAQLWERHDVEVHRSDRKRIHHPLVGTLDLECEIVFTADLDQRLVTHRAEPGSSSHAALELLKVISRQETRDPTRLLGHGQLGA